MMELSDYQNEAAKLNVTLLVEPTGDGRYEALAAPMPSDPPSSTTARPICTRETAIEAAAAALEILRREQSDRGN